MKFPGAAVAGSGRGVIFISELEPSSGLVEPGDCWYQPSTDSFKRCNSVNAFEALVGSSSSVEWDDITNKPSTFSPSTHTHLPSEVTGTAVVTNDSRLSDARTPVSHSNTAHSETYITQTAVTTHEGASDPHTGYQKESEKGSASGYAALDASSLVPVANLGTGTPDGSKFLRDDRTWQAVSGGSGLTHPQVLARGLGA